MASFAARYRTKRIRLYASLTDGHDFKTFLLRLPGTNGSTVTFERVVIRHPRLDLLALLESDQIRLVLSGEYGLKASLTSNINELEQKVERLKIVASLHADFVVRPWSRIPSVHCWLMYANDGAGTKDIVGTATFGPWIFDHATGLLSGAGQFLVTKSSSDVANSESTFMRLLHWLEGDESIVRI